MKKIFSAVLLAVLVSLLAVPVFALGLRQDGGEISDPVQLYVIGLISTVLVYALKVAAKKWPQINLKGDWLTVLLYVVAFGLAVSWSGITLPSFTSCSDPLTCVSSTLNYAQALLSAIAPATAFAMLIYNLLFQRVFEGLPSAMKWLKTRVTK